MKIDNDLKEVLRMKWQHHAGRNIPFSFSWIHLEGYMKVYPKFIGLRFKSIIIEGQESQFIMWRDPGDIKRLRKQLSLKIKNKNYLNRSFYKIKNNVERLKKLAKYLKNIEAKNLSNEEIIKALDVYYRTVQESAAAVSALIELISGYSQIISVKIKKYKEETLTYLSSPLFETTPLREEKDFLKLIKKLKSKSLRLNRVALINKHFEKYCWLTVYLWSKPWNKKDFNIRVNQALKKINPAKEMILLEKNHKENERKIEVFIKMNKLNKGEIKRLREMIYYRIEFENLFSYVGYCSFGIIKEATKRLRISFNDFFYLKKEEIEKALERNKVTALKSKIRARKKHYLVVIGKTKRHDFTGREVDLFFKNLRLIKPKKEKLPKGIKGLSGSLGQASGLVRRILRANEISKFKEGEILVTQNTTPTFLPAMKKSAAIVTDEGGITCHAAIVSRELGIPCVIGTKIATKVLKDGDKVEVDATKGIIKKI